MPLSVQSAALDRFIWNYSTQVVVAMALSAYGLECDIDEYLITVRQEVVNNTVGQFFMF